MNSERQFPRLNKSWRFTYRILEKEKILKEPLRNFTVNISGGGICFLSEQELAPKTPLAIELDSEDFPSPIMALARVAWCKTAQDGYEVGAEFWWIGWKDNNAQQTIASLVNTAIETEIDGDNHE